MTVNYSSLFQDTRSPESESDHRTAGGLQAEQPPGDASEQRHRQVSEHPQQ